MGTNAPVGVLASIVILPSCVDLAVFHRFYARLAPSGTMGAMSFVTQIVAG